MTTLDHHIRLSDPAAFRELSAEYGWDMRHMRLGAGSLGVSVWVTETQDLVLYREHFEFPMLVNGTSSAEDFSILTTPKGSCTFYGEEITQERVGLFPLGAKVDAVGRPDLETFHVQVSGERLLAEAEKAGVELIRSERAFVVTPGLDRIRRLNHVMLRANEILDSGDIARWKETEEDLMALLLSLFDSSTITGLRLPGRVKPAAVYAVEARYRIDSRLPDRVRPGDLARDLGISQRHLSRCFKDYYGIRVADFVLIRRLHEARKALQTSLLDGSVTEIAYGCGFRHLGRFAVDYRQLFGETPSQTLNQGDRQS